MSYGGTSPAGWHPDPKNPDGALRWWDGSRWTEHVHPSPGASPGYAASGGGYGTAAGPYGSPGPYGSQGPYGAPGSYGAPGPYGPPQAGNYGAQGGSRWSPSPYGAGPGLARSNQASIAAMVVTALYIALAATTRVYFLGIFPLLTAIRAVGRRERLAPFAIVAAVVALALGFGLWRPH